MDERDSRLGGSGMASGDRWSGIRSFNVSQLTPAAARQRPQKTVSAADVGNLARWQRRGDYGHGGGKVTSEPGSGRSPGRASGRRLRPEARPPRGTRGPSAAHQHHCAIGWKGQGLDRRRQVEIVDIVTQNMGTTRRTKFFAVVHRLEAQQQPCEHCPSGAGSAIRACPDITGIDS